MCIAGNERSELWNTFPRGNFTIFNFCEKRKQWPYTCDWMQSAEQTGKNRYLVCRRSHSSTVSSLATPAYPLQWWLGLKKGLLFCSVHVVQRALNDCSYHQSRSRPEPIILHPLVFHLIVGWLWGPFSFPTLILFHYPFQSCIVAVAFLAVSSNT